MQFFLISNAFLLFPEKRDYPLQIQMLPHGAVSAPAIVFHPKGMSVYSSTFFFTANATILLISSILVFLLP